MAADEADETDDAVTAAADAPVMVGMFETTGTRTSRALTATAAVGELKLTGTPPLLAN